jgi:hypothetical protein
MKKLYFNEIDLRIENLIFSFLQSGWLAKMEKKNSVFSKKLALNLTNPMWML